MAAESEFGDCTRFLSGSMAPLADEEKGRARTEQSERRRARAEWERRGRQTVSARPVSDQRSETAQSGSIKLRANSRLNQQHQLRSLLGVEETDQRAAAGGAGELAAAAAAAGDCNELSGLMAKGETAARSRQLFV